MIHYRKSGSREFYKININTGTTTRVINKKFMSRIDVSQISFITIDAMDEDSTKEITEEEFNIAFNEAFDRIKEQRL